jgi:hypothetical protein
MATWVMRPDSRLPKMVRGHMDTQYATDDRGAPSMRVLVAFEDLRSLYRDVFVRAIRDLRPA